MNKIVLLIINYEHKNKIKLGGYLIYKWWDLHVDDMKLLKTEQL